MHHPLNGDYFIPEKTDTYKQAGFKGGNDFTNLADRALGFVGNVGGVDVFVLHAPSGGQKNGPAAKAVSFLACSLNEEYGANPWLVVGDLNVEPFDLIQARVGINLVGLIKAPSDPTYIGRKKDKKYDYVLSNVTSGVFVDRIRSSPRGHGSDHYPIIVEY
ncbi:hypothetical protein KDH_08950 [Dictyobacter sp. S3.2.2.5]|uniref:Endonuclease/exonuclease/phosphatase domain-containing protein n=2 Tax=Dictyobacter halimunensis TaxID=3026934 RepID=A0ABQ6FML7_9CHLR|nr:hypothetical protein KDH_08950 [Dictyobacter sp. S3.2.2.5]